jgi:hypothetical protein
MDDRLFKKVQVEKMARIICKSSSNKGECEKCGFYPNKSCSKFEEANNLFDFGCRVKLKRE